MRIMILSTAFSGMAQRLLGELKQLDHELTQHYDLDEEVLREQVKRFKPEVILCPFLTQKIPEDIYRNHICLIVHPGIEGDRGPSSLDWAISEGAEEWGVTLILADTEMDAGDIWATQNFPLRKGSKTSIYKREVTSVAISLIKHVLVELECGRCSPRPLDYSNPNVKGRLRPLMKQKDRVIDWTLDTTDIVISKLHAADSQPGVKDVIDGVEVFLYGVSEEPKLTGKPGEILAVQYGAVCRATVDGAVWIKQLKCLESDNVPNIKLPASMVLQKLISQKKMSALKAIADTRAVDEIRIENDKDIAYVYFDFYNGAMNTQQCMSLKAALVELKQTDVKMIVFMGGEDFFSNGIHLNCIEASDDPALESWRNINAINDLVFEMMNVPNQITVSALRNNAGAGGAIMALACDEVIIREGVVLNPHYKSMGLYGSEYWTYLLPNRVGPDMSERITNACEPMLAQEALKIGLADLMFEEDWGRYHVRLKEYCRQLDKNVEIDDFLAVKRAELTKNIDSGLLGRCRNAELAKMRATFDNPKSDYHRERHAFVYKLESKDKKRKAKTPVGTKLKEILFQRVI
ncbi:MAG: hydrogenase maturation protein [Agarilytica sp.]